MSVSGPDERNRILIGDTINNLFKSVKRVMVMVGDDGYILLRPLVEIPAKEAWLYVNKEALGSVLKGIQEAKDGKISKLDESLLAPED